MNMEDLKLEEAKRLVKEMMSHGHLNMGSYSDDIDVKMWLPEMNGVNTTIFCDRLIAKYGDVLMFIHTEKECISRMNIEYQSSGFVLLDTITDEGRQILVLKSDPHFVKKHLFIPKDWMTGFAWYPQVQQFGPVKPEICPFLKDFNFNRVETAQYGHKYILNFSCSGEFNLEIYLKPMCDENLIWIFGKSYCCK